MEEPTGRYIHIKTGGHYEVKKTIPLKLNEEWTRGVIYRSVETRIDYCRPIDNFLIKFKKYDS